MDLIYRVLVFLSALIMWDRYTEDIKRSTPNLKDGNIEYGVCLNKVPDYIVGLEVTEINEEQAGYKSFTIPAGKYVKVLFNGENHEDLVDQKFMSNQKAAKKWAKSEKIKLNNEFTVEVYPKQMTEMEYPEMYCLFPIV